LAITLTVRKECPQCVFTNKNINDIIET